MKSAYKLVASTTAALAFTITLGCAPPAPPTVNTSTATTQPAASSNVTSGAETPSSNMTIGADTPVAETPAE